MKAVTHITTALSVTVTAFAGDSKEAIAPDSSPSSDVWFFGGSFGQFESGIGSEDFVLSDFNLGGLGGVSDVEDAEFDMYTLHIGRNLNQFLGCDTAAFLEVGYLNGNMDVDVFGPGSVSSSFDQSLQEVDLEVVPVTLNVKLERRLFNPVSGYLTAGVGYAFTNISVPAGSERDGGFYAQASFGLIYNINEDYEIYAGSRWMYLDSVDFGVGDLELDSALTWEVGLRYNF